MFYIPTWPGQWGKNTERLTKQEARHKMPRAWALRPRFNYSQAPPASLCLPLCGCRFRRCNRATDKGTSSPVWAAFQTGDQPRPAGEIQSSSWCTHWHSQNERHLAPCAQSSWRSGTARRGSRRCRREPKCHTCCRRAAGALEKSRGSH